MTPDVLSTRDGGIATVTLFDPGKLNALARLLDDKPLTAAEKRASRAFLDTADCREGLAAFREKRPPHFQAR